MYLKTAARMLSWGMARLIRRKRLTREDQREQTAQRLLEAAQRLIAKHGLAATSVEDIAAAAGYTRGAFYSNFGTKDALFIELLRRDHQEAMQEFFALVNDDVTVDRIHARAREIYGSLYRNNELFMNWSEARMRAVRDAKFRSKLNALMTEKRDQIAGFITYFYQRVGVPPPLPTAQMAMGFMSLVEGVKLFMLSSPMDVTPDAAEAVLRLFVDSMMQLARVQGAART
jgi:AcrR family transcriptional regulator